MNVTSDKVSIVSTTANTHINTVSNTVSIFSNALSVEISAEERGRCGVRPIGPRQSHSCSRNCTSASVIVSNNISAHNILSNVVSTIIAGGAEASVTSNDASASAQALCVECRIESALR
jgi:hypothetical protein